MTGQGVLQAFAAAEREEGMLRYWPVLAFSLTVLPTVASAQQGHLGTVQQQRACRPDVVRYCRGMDDDLLSPDLPWAQRGLQYARDFPQRDILVVVDAPTPEIAEQSTTRLAEAIEARPDRFRAVGRPGGGSFFDQNGLLFLPTDEVSRI